MKIKAERFSDAAGTVVVYRADLDAPLLPLPREQEPGIVRFVAHGVHGVHGPVEVAGHAVTFAGELYAIHPELDAKTATGWNYVVTHVQTGREVEGAVGDSVESAKAAAHQYFSHVQIGD
jgi:hypothetical protein